MKTDNKKEPLSFVFPNIMAKVMKKIDMRSQLEASLLSMTMIIIGMFLMAVYLLFFGNLTIVYKCLILFNLFCAFIFISSFLVTTYQQYLSYMIMAGIDPDKHKEEIKKRGNIFKRIKLALGNRKKQKKKSKKLELIDEAVENMVKIKQEELKKLKEIDNQNNSASQEDKII